MLGTHLLRGCCFSRISMPIELSGDAVVSDTCVLVSDAGHPWQARLGSAAALAGVCSNWIDASDCAACLPEACCLRIDGTPEPSTCCEPCATAKTGV